MLPISKAFRLAVEWPSPCPLVAVVSAAGPATSLVIGGLEPLRASLRNRKAKRLIALRLKHSLALFWADGMQKMHTPLDSNLRPDFNHPSGRNLEVVGGVVG